MKLDSATESLHAPTVVVDPATSITSTDLDTELFETLPGLPDGTVDGDIDVADFCTPGPFNLILLPIFEVMVAEEVAEL